MAPNPYKTRIGGATVTIFVPYDCTNHCPFCINKEEYAHSEGFSLEHICQSIRQMNALTPRCDVVFTGGEPFADLAALQKMLDEVPSSHNIYINTTLPVTPRQPKGELLSFLNRNRQKISCLNISRHLRRYVVESNDDLLACLPVPLRINCVLYQDYPSEKLVPFLNRFRPIPGVSVQFRCDYTATTPETLYERDHIVQKLQQVAEFIGLEGCRMRCGFHFVYRGMPLAYHKTLPYSTIRETDPVSGITYDVLYDIVIKQTGAIHSDWTGVSLNLEGYRHAVYEPYDLKWLTSISNSNHASDFTSK